MAFRVAGNIVGAAKTAPTPDSQRAGHGIPAQGDLLFGDLRGERKRRGGNGPNDVAEICAELALSTTSRKAVTM